MLAFNQGHHQILLSRKYHLNKCHWKSPNFGAATKFSLQGFRECPVHKKLNTAKKPWRWYQRHRFNQVYPPIKTCEEKACQYLK